MLLAIETSCDETAVAVLDDAKAACRASTIADVVIADLVSSQTKLHEPYGGVVPELAAREHIVNLPLMIGEALEQSAMTFCRLDAVCVTRGPGLKGCLLVGLCFAKSLALGLGVPLVTVNHLEGHLYAGELAAPGERPEYPLLALIVSGGHTLLVFAKEERSYEVVAKTRDDAAGEAFDKGAMLLGLPYPGGPSLSRAAIDGDFARYKLPVGVSGDPASFSFSGLKTALQRVVTQLGEKAREKEVVQDLAASYQAAIVRALTEKSVIACEALRPRSFVLSGGVAANESLRVCLAEEMGKRGIKYCVPARRYCTDNAAMIGLLACRIIQRNPQSYRQWRSAGPQPGYLGPGVPDDIGALAKWPLGAICP